MAAADRQKAKAKAEQLLEQVRKSPGQFAELARKNSDDPGSAERGGDLDYFGRGAMVKPFDDAVFAMKPGEISNVVESDFGYHIIQLTGQRGGEKKAFDAVRAEIEAEVKKQLAQKRYAEAAEQFTQHGVRAVRQPAAGDRQAEAGKAQRLGAAHAGTGRERRAGLGQAAGGGVRQRRGAQQAQHRRGRGRAEPDGVGARSSNTCRPARCRWPR